MVLAHNFALLMGHLAHDKCKYAELSGQYRAVDNNDQSKLSTGGYFMYQSFDQDANLLLSTGNFLVQFQAYR
jgi:hypothetical protein